MDSTRRTRLTTGAAAAAVAAVPRAFAQAAGKKEAAGRFYQKGDVRIHYQDIGSGVPLLIIHGGGRNSSGRDSGVMTDRFPASGMIADVWWFERSGVRHEIGTLHVLGGDILAATLTGAAASTVQYGLNHRATTVLRPGRRLGPRLRETLKLP